MGPNLRSELPAGTYLVSVSANSGNTFGAVTVNVTVH